MLLTPATASLEISCTTSLDIVVRGGAFGPNPDDTSTSARFASATQRNLTCTSNKHNPWPGWLCLTLGRVLHSQPRLASLGGAGITRPG